MRQLVLGSLLLLSGCGAAAKSHDAAAPVGAGYAGPSGMPAQTESAESMPAPIAASPPSDVPMNDASGPARAPATTAPAAQIAAPGAAAPARRAEMLDIEANISVEVSSVVDAAASLRRAARRFEGIVVEDVVNEQGAASNGRFTFRIAAARTDEFLDAVGKSGRVMARVVNTRDVGKEYFDSELRLQNLLVTMRRYEEILKQAKDVTEILRVEAELQRLRGEIEQSKGNLRYLQDRVSRSTVHVNLTAEQKQVVIAEAPPEPEAKFYPGLRLVQLSDLRGERGHTGYLGGGISALLSRSFSVQIDALREAGTGSPTSGLDAVLVTLGGEMYSEFLGGGRRKFLNPYLGFNVGYARIRGQDEGLAGATLGVELVRSKAVLVEASVRGFGMFFSEKPHVGVEPALGVSFPF